MPNAHCSLPIAVHALLPLPAPAPAPTVPTVLQSIRAARLHPPLDIGQPWFFSQTQSCAVSYHPSLQITDYIYITLHRVHSAANTPVPARPKSKPSQDKTRERRKDRKGSLSFSCVPLRPTRC